MDKFQYFIDYINKEPLIIQILWVLICVLTVSAVILIIYLKFLRSHLRKTEKNIEKYSKEYELVLVTYLYSEGEGGGISEEQQTIINKLKVDLKEKFKSKIIVSLLLKLRNEISGEMADSIENLYSQTKLKDKALEKLKSKDWYSIASGIRELTLFNVKDIHDEVVKHVNHAKREIRKEVQLYLVNLFHFKGLNFLNDLTTPISEWDQIQLLEELQKFEDQEIPDITLWLKSTNDYVVIFALKLAKIYNQFGMKEVLIDLLSHKNEKVRLELIPVLSYLHVIEAKEILKRNFNQSSIDEQIAFFELLKSLNESSDESFILEHIHHENFEIKLLAISILKDMNINAFENLKLPSSDSEFVKIFQFIKNN